MGSNKKVEGWEGSPESRESKWIILSVRLDWPEVKVRLFSFSLLPDRANQPMTYEHHSSVYVNCKSAKIKVMKIM